MQSVTLPFPPKELSPNARVHWAVKRKHTKACREEAFILAKKAGLSASGGCGVIDLSIEFYPPSNRSYDLDNLLSRSKGMLDGIADAMQVNDKRFALKISRLHSVKGGQVIVRIE